MIHRIDYDFRGRVISVPFRQGDTEEDRRAEMLEIYETQITLEQCAEIENLAQELFFRTIIPGAEVEAIAGWAFQTAEAFLNYKNKRNENNNSVV